MRLPSYQQLSKEQDVIHNLPLDESHIVTGPPGTGKTIMALYRTSMIQNESEPVQLITFSKVLKSYIASAYVALSLKGEARTFHSWMWSFYRANLRRQPPEIEKWEFDWPEILRDLNSCDIPARRLANVIIDEAQDLPPPFFMVARLMSQNMMVFADENQRLEETTNSTISDIQNNSTITRQHTLKRNYRNTQEIAEVAAHFYAGVPTGIPELPEREGDYPTIRSFVTSNDCVEFIARYERNHPEYEIGVLLPQIKQVTAYKNRLDGKTHNKVRWYARKKGTDAPEFDKPGILVAAYASAKGLEFDTVFLPELQEASFSPGEPKDKMRMYVLCSRAREELHLSWAGQRRPSVVEYIPDELVEDLS